VSVDGDANGNVVGGDVDGVRIVEWQRTGGGGRVERDVATLDAIKARHVDVVADEHREPLGGHVKMIWPPAALS
jgi:hypothetical protein